MGLDTTHHHHPPQTFRPLLGKVGLGMLTLLRYFLGRALARAPISGFWLHPPPPSHSSHPPPPSHSSHFNIRLNDQAYNCLIHFYKIDYHDNLRWKMTLDGRQPLMEDDPWWKTTFDGRWTLMEDDLWWKMTFEGRRHSMEVNLQSKTTFNGRGHLMEDDI